VYKVPFTLLDISLLGTLKKCCQQTDAVERFLFDEDEQKDIPKEKNH